MKLFVITTERFFDREAEAINRLFENGLEVLHLRKSYASQQETTSFIEQIHKEFHLRIVLHDHYSLTAQFNLKGIHLNRRNQVSFLEKNSTSGLTNVECPNESNALCTFLRSYHLTVLPSYGLENNSPRNERKWSLSRSCHSFEEVSESRFCDYVFLSPVFDSISKEGYSQKFTEEQLHDAKEKGLINECVIALGGVTAKNISIARRYGFGGVAVLGALWSDYTDKGNVCELLRRFDELKEGKF